MNGIIILGLLISNEVADIVTFQQLLTKYGNVIRTRLGLHESHYETPKIKGLLLLEMVGDAAEIASFESAASKISGIQVQKMAFSL
ncbi:MAG: hypothetical protein FWF09_02360 [Bacteroidales bacterium]|nr:hypothetical protein [Bacteroidales bacterium]